jgi:hypothetical protein
LGRPWPENWPKRHRRIRISSMFSIVQVFSSDQSVFKKLFKMSNVFRPSNMMLEAVRTSEMYVSYKPSRYKNEALS